MGARERAAARRGARALAVALTIAILPAFARAGDGVSGLEVQGNTRTRTDVVLRALGVRPGDVVADAALPALRQRVMNLRLFSDVSVERRASDAGDVLVVTVKERWTLLPIPLLGADDGGVTAGLTLIESNLFGRRKTLVAMGIYSNRGQTAYLLYRDPELFGTRAVLAADLVADNTVHERADGFDVVEAWRERRLEASVRPGLALARRLQVRAGPFVSAREADGAEGYASPPSPGTDLGLAADLEYDGQDYQDWVNVGPSLRVSARRALSALGSDRDVAKGTVQAGWTALVRGRHALSASVAGFATDGDPVLDAFQLGGRPGARGVRAGGIWAERAATATLDHQVPVWRPAWGTLAVTTFVDAGVSSWRGEQTRWVAPGLGIRLYVRQVAIPALGLDFAWSTAGDRVAPTFFLGF